MAEQNNQAERAAPELLPCPMCANAAKIHGMEEYFMVACECGVNYEGPSSKDCTEAWNRRSAPAAGTVEKDAELADVLNTTLWLYRRLPHAYGKPPFVDRAILTMAERLGLDDVPEAIKERAAIEAHNRAGKE